MDDCLIGPEDDSLVTMSSGFEFLTEAQLRTRGTKKWVHYSPDVLPMWVAEMDFTTAPAVQAAIRDVAEREMYGYIGHDAELISAYVAWADSYLGSQIDPDKVVVIRDVLTGVELGIEVFSPPGSPVVLPSPAYMPFWLVPGAVDREIITVPMTTDAQGREALDLEAIGAAFAAGAKSMILCQPYNPLGRVFDADELRALAEVAEQHDAWIISDEIHAPLVFGARTIPFASVSETAARRCVTVTSGSKAWNIAGLRCALVMVHTDQAWAQWQRTRPELKIYGASSFGVSANAAAFREGGPWLEDCLRALDANATWLGEFVARELPEVGYRKPEGTYLAWLDLRSLNLPDEPGAWLLKNAQVAVNSGPSFGPGGDGFVRLNFATSPELLAEGCRRIADAVAKR